MQIELITLQKAQFPALLDRVDSQRDMSIAKLAFYDLSILFITKHQRQEGFISFRDKRELTNTLRLNFCFHSKLSILLTISSNLMASFVFSICSRCLSS